ncbi:MAG TPA: substrate-binding domain-containing protein [Lachnospiraceae bacterium]
MKKQVLATLLVATMAAAMVGCGAEKSKESTSEKTTEEKKEASSETLGDVNGDGKIVCGYISKNLTDPFHAAINDYAQTTFDSMKKDGTIDDWTGILDGETDANKQIDRANDCIAKGCDYVVMLPAEAEASNPALVAMVDAGIKVIEVNSQTTDCDTLAMAYCGSDDVQAGEMLAEWIVKNCPDGGKYVHCTGILGNSAQVQRGEGIENIMKDHPEFEKVAEPDTQWDGNLAANATTDAIATYGQDLVAVICDNDGMSSSAQKAANNAGRKDIVCVGVDGIDVALQMVKEGTMLATVYQDGVAQLAAGIDIIKASVEGKEFDKKPDIPFVLVTSENIDKYYK